MVFSSFLLLEPFPLCEAFSIWLSLKRIAWGFGYIGISLLKASGFLGIFGCFYSFCCWYLFHYASLSLSGFWSLKRIAWGFEYIGISLLEGFLTCICICHLSVWTFPDLPNKYILQSEQIYFDIWAKTFKYRFLRNLSGLSNRVFIYSMDFFRRVRFQFFKLPVVHHTS